MPMRNEPASNDYKSYDYKEALVKEEQVSFCIDGYQNFGWLPDENRPMRTEQGKCRIWLKRDREIANKTELTRLERNFEACLAELDALEHAKYTMPEIVALVCGIVGTAFMAGSVFAVTAEPPIVWLCVLLAIPGFVGWGLPPFLYSKGVENQTKKITPFIESKRNELDALCKKGHSLLS